MELQKALIIAERIKEELAPYCDRIEIGGSIRRKKPQVSDVEIVCIPKTGQDGKRDQGYVKIVDGWEAIRGKATGKMTRRVLPDGIEVDIFMVVPDNWGFQFAMRTGSADFSRFVIIDGIIASGHKADVGFVWKDNKMIPMREEKDLFDLWDSPVPPPEKRNV